MAALTEKIVLSAIQFLPEQFAVQVSWLTAIKRGDVTIYSFVSTETYYDTNIEQFIADLGSDAADYEVAARKVVDKNKPPK